MKQRDKKYRAAREKLFTTNVGRDYLRELSIDELPGLTTPETTAVMLALCEALEMRIRQVKRNSDHGLHAGAAPLIGEVALGAELLESLGVQLLVKLMDEALEGRALEL